ncbi:MAG TPA: tetratricopeptide repeat protein, partial [Vicinamibacterales bacterium]
LATILLATGDYYQAERIPDAEKEYRVVLTLDDHAAVAANNLAGIYASNNRNLDDALQLALIAAHRLPDEPHVNDTLGWVYYRKHLAVPAVKCLEASVKADSTDPVTHYHLGMAYLQAGDATGAKRSLRRALAMQPNFEGAKEARDTIAGIGR